MVDLESSVLVVVVPSGDWLTVFSFVLTVPSPLSLLLLVVETSLSHPTSRNDNAKADAATHITAIRFIIIRFIAGSIRDSLNLRYGGNTPYAEQAEATGLNLKNAVESTQRRKGARTQRFRLLGTFTRWGSKFKAVLPAPFPCPFKWPPNALRAIGEIIEPL